MSVITLIGAGSAIFGENTIASLLRSTGLRGSTLRLVDHNLRSLEIVLRFAQRLNKDWRAEFTITAHQHHSEALDGSGFVVSAIEVGPREDLWRSDYEIPLKYGLRQPYAENGGPGGFAHAARNIGPVMTIVREMERICPQAWFINFTNPMMRICDAVHRHSAIKIVGLCHQIYLGYCLVGVVLAEQLGIEVPPGLDGLHADILQYPLQQRVIKQTLPLVEIIAAGTNHFTWIVSIVDKRNGRDLYPVFRDRFLTNNLGFEPLTRRVFQDMGLCPVPGDTHLSEYLPWVADPLSKPWEKYNLRLYDWHTWSGLREFSLDRLNDIAGGAITTDGLLAADSEGAVEVIENISCAGEYSLPAANTPNAGQIENLPVGSIVETPVRLNGEGIHPVHMGSLPDAIAELCRREIAIGQLCVDSAIEASYSKALQCLLLDPMITDMDQAKNILTDYIQAYKNLFPSYLPACYPYIRSNE